jgi:altronate hydrolase
MVLISLQETPALRLHPTDDVAIALIPLPAGRAIAIDSLRVRLTAAIAPGHKFALRAVEPGAPVRRYGQVIGFAAAPIAPGDHVHSHNLAVGKMTLDYRNSP